MNNEVFVSVSCLTYNHSLYIEKCLDGFIMQQCDFNFEVLVHDDASTDGTIDIIRKYQVKYPDIIKPLIQTENQYSKKQGSISARFNYPRAKGKYIALCEGDDYWTDPLKLQKQVDFLEQNEEYGLIYSDINKVDKNNVLIEQNSFTIKPLPICENFEDYLIKAPFLAPCTWMFRKELIKARRKTYVVGDLPLLLDIAAHSKIHQLKETTANYRVLSESASHFTTVKEEYDFMKGIYKVQMDYAKNYNVSEHVIEAIKIKHAFISYNFAVAEHDIKQVKIANELLKNHPWVSFKFKAVQFISKFRLGRILYKKILKKRIGN